VAALVWLATAGASDRSPVRFEDVSASAGVTFEHQTGRFGRRYIVETASGGVLVLDYDGDGRPDLYFVNGAPLPGHPDHGTRDPGNALYRNRGDGTFEDVTDAAGVRAGGYGMGGSAADIDNDGDLDIYVTRFGPDLLLRNRGDGTFTDATADAGLGDGRWSSSASFVDLDGDGFVDLFVCNYLDFTLEKHKTCVGTDREGRATESYCHPDEYGGTGDLLYRNRGDGRFEDLSVRAGVVNPQEGKGLGVVASDYDGDGDQDLYVANDTTRNFLYRNDGDWRFEDLALTAGVGYNEDGLPEAGMGTDFGDIDRDGRPDLVVTNFDLEKNTVYRNVGGGFFVDGTTAAGLAGASLTELGFGCDFFDADNDGWLDLMIANGHIIDNVEAMQPSLRYAQPKQFFRNRGDGRFEDLTRAAGADLSRPRVGRGLATLDFDADGDLDVAICNNGGPAELLRNQGGNDRGWLGLALVSARSNRSGIGARVELLAGGLRQTEEVRTSSGYLAQNQIELHFGLGLAEQVDEMIVHWPSGQVDRFTGVAARSALVVKEGVGILTAGGPSRAPAP
jgi:hypothetical protein